MFDQLFKINSPGERALNRLIFILIGTVIFSGCNDSQQNRTTEAPHTTPAVKAKPAPATTSSKAASDEFTDPREVLVPGEITVDVMGLAVPQRAEEIGQKFKQALSKNPDWLVELSKKRKPGEPLPYDERMGISKAEYDEFINLSQKLTARKMKEAPFSVTQKSEDVFVLDGGKELNDLTGIEIDLKQDQVQTPFGTLTERSVINAPEHAALGAWKGVQWQRTQTDSNGITGTVAKLAIGKLKQLGRCVLYYDVRKMTTDGKKTRISQILNYDIP